MFAPVAYVVMICSTELGTTFITSSELVHSSVFDTTQSPLDFTRELLSFSRYQRALYMSSVQGGKQKIRRLTKTDKAKANVSACLSTSAGSRAPAELIVSEAVSRLRRHYLSIYAEPGDQIS